MRAANVAISSPKASSCARVIESRDNAPSDIANVSHVRRKWTSDIDTESVHGEILYIVYLPPQASAELAEPRSAPSKQTARGLQWAQARLRAARQDHRRAPARS